MRFLDPMSLVFRTRASVEKKDEKASFIPESDVFAPTLGLVPVAIYDVDLAVEFELRLVFVVVGIQQRLESLACCGVGEGVLDVRVRFVETAERSAGKFDADDIVSDSCGEGDRRTCGWDYNLGQQTKFEGLRA
jgi:hypothetical protein